MNEARSEITIYPSHQSGALALYTAGGLFWAFLPFFIGMQTETGEMTQAQAGTLGSAYLIGFSLVSVSALWWASRLSWRVVAGAATVAVAVSLFAMGIVNPYFAKVLVVGFIGIAMGSFWSIAYRIFGASENSERMFAIGIVVSYTALAAVTFVISRWVIPVGGLTLTATVLAVLVMLLGLGALAIPRGEGGHAEADPLISFRPPGDVATALLGILATAVAFAAIWAFAERIGVHAGFDHKVIGPVISFNLLATAAGSLAATALAPSMKRKLALLVGLSVMALCVLSLLNAETFWVYGAAITGLGLSVGFVLPFQMATVSDLDASGKFVALIAAAQGLGSAAGPFIGGLAADVGGYQALVGIAFIALMVSGLCFVLVQPKD